MLVMFSPRVLTMLLVFVMVVMMVMGENDNYGGDKEEREWSR